MKVRIHETEFSPELSDGCTVINKIYKFFTGKDETPWRACCIQHDAVYWYGGDKKLRKQADDELRDCVKAMGYPITAFIMWAAVRIFSGEDLFKVFHNPFSWHWCEEVIILSRLTEEEKAALEHSLVKNQ